MKRAIYFLSRLAFGLGAVCAAILVWGFFLEESYLSYPTLPLPPLALQVRAGDVVPLLARRCNSRPTKQTYAVRRELRPLDKRNPVLLEPNDQTVGIDSGCTEIISRLQTIPEGAAPGFYEIHGDGITKGTITQIKVPFRSGVFEVIP